MNSFLKNSFLPPLILATLLAGGALVVWGVAMVMLGSAYVEWRSSQQVVESLQITSSGQAIIETWRAKSPEAHLFTDLERRPVNLADVEPRSVSQPHARYNTYQTFLRSHTLEAPQFDQQWPVRGRFSIRGLSHGSMPDTNWFLMNVDEPAERAYLVGFDRRSKQCVGYVGVRGFRLDKPPIDEQFAIGARPLFMASEALHSNWGRAITYNRDRTPLLIISDDKLYAVDLHFAAPQVTQVTPGSTDQKTRVDRTVRQLPLDEPVVSMSFVNQAKESTEVDAEARQILVRTPKRVLLIDMDGKLLRSAEIPPQLSDKRFSIYVPIGDEILFQVDEMNGDQFAIGLNWVNTKTAAVRSERFVMHRKDEGPRQVAWQLSASVPSPAALAIFYCEFIPAVRRAEMRPIDAAQIFGDTWPAFALVCVLSAAAAIYTYRRQKRYGPRGAVAWALFVLIVGPAGLLGYLWHRRWPVLDRCASCGADAPRDRGDCVACHTEFPAPKQIGCEVFA